MAKTTGSGCIVSSNAWEYTFHVQYVRNFEKAKTMGSVCIVFLMHKNVLSLHKK